MLSRIIGVITLRAQAYRDIAADKTATGQAALIVIIATLLAGFSEGLVGTESNATTLSVGRGVVDALVTVIHALIGWAFSAWVLAFVAKIIFHGKTNTLEMLRVTGFVHVFDIVSILVLLKLVTPGVATLGAIIIGIAAILRLIGYIVGVREAARLTTLLAILTAIVAWVVEGLIRIGIGLAILGAILLALRPLLG